MSKPAVAVPALPMPEQFHADLLELFSAVKESMSQWCPSLM